MFSGFWGWFLVVVIVAVIFGAGKLPDLKVQAEEKLKLLASAAEKGKRNWKQKSTRPRKNAKKTKRKTRTERKTNLLNNTVCLYRAVT